MSVVQDRFDAETASQRMQEMLSCRGSTRGLSLLINEGADHAIDEGYAYRISDLRDLLPAGLWVKASYWAFTRPKPGHQYWDASANALAARIRLHYCEEARDRGYDSPRLKTAIIKEREAVFWFRKLSKFYREKGIAE